MNQPADEIPELVIERWSRLPGGIVSRIDTGLINDTYMITDERARTVIVQRLHTVFSADVNLDIAAVTEVLRSRDIETPELIPTDDNELWVEHDGRVWRALSYVPGLCYQRIEKPVFAAGAGLVAGRFHLALADFDYTYRFARTGVHDTAAHMTALKAAMSDYPGHELAGTVTELAANVLSAAVNLKDFSSLPVRHAHGDLKISNIVFDESGGGVCLIDLDTLGKQCWSLEMGDALRSWCNPLPEDAADAHVDIGLFKAALAGYAGAGPSFLTANETAALVPGISTVTLGLVARFLTDALEDRYFGWDRERYENRSQHNLARARGMWHLYRDIREQHAELEGIVSDTFG